MILGFITRTAIVAGAVYYSRELGVWSDSRKTEEIYNGIKSDLRPHVAQISKQIPFEFPALPSSGEIFFLTNHYYNQGVKQTFRFVEMLPCYTGQIIQKTKNAFDEFSQASPSSKTSNEK